MLLVSDLNKRNLLKLMSTKCFMFIGDINKKEELKSVITCVFSDSIFSVTIES